MIVELRDTCAAGVLSLDLRSSESVVYILLIAINSIYIQPCYRQWTIVVVLTLTRIIKSVVIGQAPVTLELRNTPGKKHKPKVVHAYITADASHASARNIHKVKSGVSLRCARSILVHTSHYSCLEKPTIPLATQERLPRI